MTGDKSHFLVGDLIPGDRCGLALATSWVDSLVFQLVVEFNFLFITFIYF